MKITQINFEASLAKNRLIFSNKSNYLFDLFFQIFFVFALDFGLILNILEWNNYDRNQKSFLIVGIIIALIFNIIVYFKIIETKFSKINTSNFDNENRKIILEYLKQEQIPIKAETENIIIAVDDLGDQGLLNNKKNSIVFLLDSMQIYFTIFSERNKVNYPGLFDKYSLKKSLSQKIKLS